MDTKKHALVLFTKYPEPGATKTRFTESNDTNLTVLEAAELYKAMVLDTAEVALVALGSCRKSDTEGGEYAFWISSSPENKMPKVRKMFGKELPSSKIEYLVDKGRNFDEHLDSCYGQLFDMGYQSVICIGGDLPGITPSLICRTFSALINMGSQTDRGAMALAPCQAGGVSLVGITREARINFKGAFYNPDGLTTLDVLVNIAANKDIPLALFETVPDVDCNEDLGHMISMINAMEYASRFQEEIIVPQRTWELIKKFGLTASSPPNMSSDSRKLIDAG